MHVKLCIFDKLSKSYHIFHIVSQGKDIANLIFKYVGAHSEEQTRKQGGAGLAGVLRSQPDPVRQ